MAECFARVSRNVVASVNSAILLALLTAGLILYKQFSGIRWLDLVQNQVPFQVVIGAAACAAVSAIYGYFTICCKSKGCRMIYMMIVLIVIIFEVVVILLIIKYDETIISMLQDTWSNSEEDKDLMTLRKAIEKAFGCCGFDNETSPTRFEPSYECGYAFQKTEQGDPLADFCTETLEESVKGNTRNIMIVGLVLAVMEIVLLICAIYQVRTAEKRRDSSSEGGVSRF